MKMDASSRRYIARQRETNSAGYLARTLRNKMAWTRANPERVAEISAGVRSPALASKAHLCEDCNLPLQSEHALTKHKGTAAHAEQVRLNNGGAPKVVSANALRAREFVAKNKANKKHYCAVCALPFGREPHYVKHLTSKKHARNVKKAAASAAASRS